jgi:hypothetical protein
MVLSWSSCSSCAIPSWGEALRWRGDRNGVAETLVSMAFMACLMRKFRSSSPSIFMCPMATSMADLRFCSRFIFGFKPRWCPDSMIELTPS